MFLDEIGDMPVALQV
ncbi:hypothetical protein JTL96_35410, partial [Pseudomonas aeruginosa]|nr:hypothetical protein [Pseudomonas aeruginosa]